MTAAWLLTWVSNTRARQARSGRNLSDAAEAGRLARFADEKHHLLAMVLRDVSAVADWQRRKGDIPITHHIFCAPRPALEQGRYSSSDS